MNEPFGQEIFSQLLTHEGRRRAGVDRFFLICSAGPRGLGGDPRIFDDRTKVRQVFRYMPEEREGAVVLMPLAAQ